MSHNTGSLLDRWMSEQKDLHVSGAPMVQWDDNLREIREQTASPFERPKKRHADFAVEDVDAKAFAARRQMLARFQRQLLDVRAAQLAQELRKLNEDIRNVGDQRRRASLAVTSYPSAHSATFGHSHGGSPLAAIEEPNFSTKGTASVASASTNATKPAMNRRWKNREPFIHLSQGDFGHEKLEQLAHQASVKRFEHVLGPRNSRDRIFKVAMRPRPRSLPPTRAASVTAGPDE